MRGWSSGVAYLGVEPVKDGEECGVGAAEEEIGSPVDVGDHDGNDHDDDKVEQPVGAGGCSVGLATGLEGVDLSGIQPGKRQPGSTERSNVGEETSDSTL